MKTKKVRMVCNIIGSLLIGVASYIVFDSYNAINDSFKLEDEKIKDLADRVAELEIFCENEV